MFSHLLWAILAIPSFARHLEPTEPFSPPLLHRGDSSLSNVFSDLERKLQNAVRNSSSPWNTNITSYSIAVTSASETLWGSSYTAPILGNYSNSSPTNVTDQTYFRIASISKVFTVLAALIQQRDGKWSLKDPITKHVPELKAATNSSTIDWESITLETLASQLSGIPREYIQSDLLDPLELDDYGFNNPVDVGLPPVDDDDVPRCGSNRSGGTPCSRNEIIKGFIKRGPVFAPNYQATYCNVAFVLLGFALENLTGLTYDELVRQTIFDPLAMKRATLKKPHDSGGVIPNLTNDWDADVGTYGPTGGIYTTASDLARFARSVLTNTLLDVPTTNAWLKPRSSSFSWEFAYGMPWEVFRSSDILSDSNRIQTIVTKAGGLRGYSSQLLLIPEYDVALVLLVAGDGHALGWMREEILKAVVPAVEQIARRQSNNRLDGTYASPNAHMNSSVTVKVQGSSGLVVTSWISNGTDFLARYIDMSGPKEIFGESSKVQLIPTRTRRGKNGEVWRTQFVPQDVPSSEIINMNLVNDVDQLNYASRSVQEFVFQLDVSGCAVAVKLPAFRITLEKRKERTDEQRSFFSWDDRLMRPLGLNE
ncbi:MAG: hypothetical protein Q9218_004186 [Villophora microphyllina]